MIICHHTLGVHQLQDVNAIPDHHWALRGEAPGNDRQVLQEPWAAASQAESWTFPASIHSFRPWWEPNTSRLGSLSAIRPAWSAAGCHSAWWRISPGCPWDDPGWGEVSHQPSFWWNSVTWVGSRTSCTGGQEHTVDGKAMRGKEVGVCIFFELWFHLDKCPGAYGSSISRFLRNQHTVLHSGCTHSHSH